VGLKRQDVDREIYHPIKTRIKELLGITLCEASAVRRPLHGSSQSDDPATDLRALVSKNAMTYGQVNDRLAHS